MADDDDDQRRAEREAIQQRALHLVAASETRGTRGHDDALAQSRSVQAVTLRLAGLTYEQIAERVGYYDRGAARAAVLRALDRVEAETVADLRTIENARLDRAQAAIWPAIIGPTEGDAAVPFDHRNKAANTFLRISERRSRLNGLDAPVKVALTPTTVEVQAWVAEVIALANPDAQAVVDADVIDVEPDDEQPKEVPANRPRPKTPPHRPSHL